MPRSPINFQFQDSIRNFYYVFSWIVSILPLFAVILMRFLTPPSKLDSVKALSC